MDIEVEKTKDDPKAPISGIYTVDLKISDGIQFGLGLAISLVICGIVVFVITMIIGVYIKGLVQSYNKATIQPTTYQKIIK